MSLGACLIGQDACRFLVWAPRVERVDVHLVAPKDRLVPLAPDAWGYQTAVIPAVPAGSRYRYRLNGQREHPDPASRFQPEGLHGPSQVVDPAFPWTDQGWMGLPLECYVIYELHVGTFTPEGTFDAVIPHLDRLKDLGITAIELMPVGQFPGQRNWGYDGALPFAVQHSYGGPGGLKRLVNACHTRGLVVILDVVYNHLGPEGSVLPNFGPYLTERYRTPWGPAMNFDGAENREVRRYVIENALSWVSEYHVDALRLDALHAIVDHSAQPWLGELTAAIHAWASHHHRRVILIGESDLNDPRLLLPPAQGGTGLDAQWNDDFHHALHALMTGERNGSYADFGGVSHLAKAMAVGYVYDGQYSIYRRRRHGAPSASIPARQLIVYAQNHDQVGNRQDGERLSRLTSFEALKLAAGVVILSPYLPLLFMGEEDGETAPFLYFTSHTERELIEAVRRGRTEEFAAFDWHGEAPDPQAEETFQRSKLQHALGGEAPSTLWTFYQTLLQLRRTLPALARPDKDAMDVEGDEDVRALTIRRWHGEGAVFMVFHFGRRANEITCEVPVGNWRKALDSAEARWRGPGSRLPDDLQSGGRVSLTVAAETCVLFVKRQAGGIE